MIPRPLLAFGTMVFVALALPVAAQQSAHLRGEITAMDGDHVTLVASDGEGYDVTMVAQYALMVYEGIPLSEIDTGDYLSIPSIPGPDGEKIAVSINVFPEELRGTGEGERAWDLTETSQMTNATLGDVVENDAGAVLVVSYGDTEEPVLVPEGTPITRFAPDADRRLQVGDQTVLFVDMIEGEIVASFAGISDDGSLPPI